MRPNLLGLRSGLQEALAYINENDYRYTYVNYLYAAMKALVLACLMFPLAALAADLEATLTIKDH